jgi:hypothetical protein
MLATPVITRHPAAVDGIKDRSRRYRDVENREPDRWRLPVLWQRWAAKTRFRGRFGGSPVLAREGSLWQEPPPVTAYLKPILSYACMLP